MMGAAAAQVAGQEVKDRGGNLAFRSLRYLHKSRNDW
jgi:hypothetical protein